ncbi:MAG: hypothetical protein L0387_03950 [Acidobacteria bacterium]|nr:hypothetical protein [Acidobacteriota bacterium]
MRKAVNAENLLNLGSVYGDRNAGDPVEYDHLKLILTDDIVEITVFNRELRCSRRTMSGFGASTGSYAGWTRNRP